MLAPSAHSQGADSSVLSVHRIYGTREFRAQPFGPARWLGDGSAYTTLEASEAERGQNLVRYDSERGGREVLVAARQFIPQGDSLPLAVEEYSWSPDTKLLLIFTNTRPVWRLNTRGDYWVLERASGRLRKLGGPDAKPSTLMFAKFAPDGGRVAYVRVAYVRENNLYVEDIASGTITPLTTDGSRTLINGTFDWVYEEELMNYYADGWRWSPDGRSIAYWQLNADQVKDFLRRGATLVANDIDHLSPGLTAFADAMERALGGKVQGNLYTSSRRRQGFGAHFDTHDVYAVHVEGTKTWHIYEGRATDPIPHPSFKFLGREYHEKAKGALLMDVHMEPGDLLYLPRGQYHDALADEGGTVHVAFGITYPIGLDVVSFLFERVVAEPEFRANLPRRGGPDAGRALSAHLARLGDKISAILAEPKTAAQITELQRGFRYPRHAYELPALLTEPADDRFRVRAKGIRMVQQGGRFGLVREGSRAATEVPADVSAMVSWVLERREFSRNELAAAFPERQSTQLEQLLRDLDAMRLTEPI